jgi:hypothetical protein
MSEHQERKLLFDKTCQFTLALLVTNKLFTASVTEKTHMYLGMADATLIGFMIGRAPSKWLGPLTPAHWVKVGTTVRYLRSAERATQCKGTVAFLGRRWLVLFVP